MRNDLVELVFVFDRSGSMTSIYQTAVAGFKEYIQSQLGVPGDCTLSLYTFDNTSEKVLDRVSLKDTLTQSLIAENTALWFRPRGSTALFDTVARAIRETGEKLAATPEHLRPGKVILVTITDGYENCSTFTSRDALRSMIEHQQGVYKWDFVFIGANQDAVLTAQGLGIRAEAALTYLANDASADAMMRTLGNYTSSARYACAKGVDINAAFSAEERSAVLDAGQSST